MRFVCNKCNTKYSIPDNKVAGKILKLRCKKCGNIIVLKDPKIASDKQQSSKSHTGKNLLHDAFKQSLSDNSFPSSFDNSFSSEQSTFTNEEKTQIAKIPHFDDPVIEEEWYLADSRGQFGPMTLAELTARIKRGEPKHDAVVWKDGFEDWLPISDVTELKPYYKHIPPPRKPTQEIKKAEEQPTTDSVPHVYDTIKKQNKSSVANVSYASNISTTKPTEQVAPIIITAPQTSNAKWFAIGGGMVALSVVIFLLGSKMLSSKADVPPQKTQQQIEQQQPKQVATTEKPKIKTETVYIVPTTTQNTNNTQKTKHSLKSRRRLGHSSAINKIEAIPNTIPQINTIKTRSKADLKSVMRTNKEQIYRCFALAVRKGQKELVDHKVVFMLKIQPSGKVSSVNFDGSVPPIMKYCLKRSIKSWKFPKGIKTSNYNFIMHFN